MTLPWPMGVSAPVWSPLDGQKFPIVIQFSGAGRFKHDPFPIAVGFGFVVPSADGLGESGPDLFEFGSLRRSKDDQEAEAIWLGI